MNFGTLNLTFSLNVIATLSALLLGAFIWWLVRSKQKRVWLPTLRVLDIDAQTLPKLQTIPPPWVAFLCFLIIGLALVTYSLAPAKLVFSPFEPEEKRIHFLVDLSPSVSARATIEQLRDKVQSDWQALSAKAQVSLSTSASAKIYTPANFEELQTILSAMEFHRYGVKLGQLLGATKDEFGRIDQLRIFSDGDRFSWRDFNWQFFDNDMNVTLVRIGATRPLVNAYIDRVSLISSPTAPVLQWDVDIFRSGTKAEALKGTLQIFSQGLPIKQTPFALDERRSSVFLRLEIPADDLRAQSGKASNLEFRLDVDDDFKMDNQFFSYMRQSHAPVGLVGIGTGEQPLEDNTFHLEKTLSVLSFPVQRIENLRQPGPEADRYALWVLVGGSGLGVQEFCPSSLFNRKRPTADKQKPVKVWLLPQTLQSDYKELCACFASLTSSQNAAAIPAYCANATSRENYASILSSLGAKQVGGEIAEVDKALAWRMVAKDANVDVLAFSVPLAPSRIAAISHARLPLLVRGLLQMSGFAEHDASREGMWPRLSTPPWISSGVEDEASAQPVAMDEAKLSNIPQGESQLEPLAAKELPSGHDPFAVDRGNAFEARRSQTDPKPWLQGLIYVVIAACLLEGIYLLFSRWRISRRSLARLLLGMAFGAAAVGAQDVWAQVRIAGVGYNKGNARMQLVARDVAGRTSIELDAQPSLTSSFDRKLLSNAWLWSKGTGPLKDKNGSLKRDLVLWLKRGGFLVVEGFNSQKELKQLTENLERDVAGNVNWQAIPPDHELMRSFHLIDALPICGQEIWHGLQFDSRLAVLAIPYGFLESLLDEPTTIQCKEQLPYERRLRLFVNILMVVLATDYKKDQIHLPEILKRLR